MQTMNCSQLFSFLFCVYKSAPDTKDSLDNVEQCQCLQRWLLSVCAAPLFVSIAVETSKMALNQACRPLQQQPYQMKQLTPTTNRPPHVLELPEIVYRITWNMDAADVLACSGVSRSVRSSFLPYVWQDLHFGTQCILDREKTPLSRFIAIPNPLTTASKSEGHDDEEDGLNNPLLEVLQKNAPWIQSLTIKDHDSVLPLKVGMGCTRLESITLDGLCWDGKKKHEDVYWKTCREMMHRNRSQLKSLSLSNWIYDSRRKPEHGQPRWNPILKCTQSWNLRSLTLRRCFIRGHHLDALWEICGRLEVLTMLDCYLNLSLRPAVIHRKESKSKESTAGSTDMTATTIVEPISPSSTPRFPRLKDLTVGRTVFTLPHRELDLLIRHCPRLETLCWVIYGRRRLAMEEFLTLYEASTWPELDSISFKGDDLRISNESHCRLLRAAKKPLRRIDASTIGVEETTYNLLRSRHFATIEIIDFFNANFVKQEWINEVLTSCPNLQKFRAKSIRAQDMLRSPWVCLGLQRLVVFIDMGFPDHGSYRKLTEEELGQCRAVYKQLAALKELRVLDTLTSYGPLCAYSGVVYNDPSHPRHLLVPLPVRLEAGLDLLATSKKLEMVLFWGGRHVVHKKTLIWMVDNWKLLKYLCGRWRIREGSYNEVKDRYFWSGQLQKWLAQHGIRTEGSHYEQAPSDEYDVADCGNCCALSDDEEETGGD